MNTPALTALSALNGAARLPGLGLIRARGADAASFLHGQLSNDLLKVSAGQARLAAFCSAQGRMLASFVVGWRPDTESAAGERWLVCAADVQAATLKRLRLFVLRAKAVLEDPGASAQVIGLAGSQAAAWLGEAGSGLSTWQQVVRDGAAVVRLPDACTVPRWLWIGDAAAGDALLARLPAVDEALWAWGDVSSGVTHVTAATSGQFVPQMLNFELVGGVDFRKGCYPGQEVVARSQYLGKLKRRAFLLSTTAPATSVQPGQDIFWSQDPDQPAGMVAQVAAVPGGGGTLLLAELKVAAASDGALHLAGADGPLLSIQPLPYEIPPNETPVRLG